MQLTEGSGSILVVAVGVNTEYGKTMSLVMTEAPSTPLQEHLEVLATSIGKVGLVVAVVCFFVLLIRSGHADCYLEDILHTIGKCQVCQILCKYSPTSTAIPGLTPCKLTLPCMQCSNLCRHADC